MCYAYGSIDQAVNVCPMCKVFPHPRSVLAAREAPLCPEDLSVQLSSHPRRMSQSHRTPPFRCPLSQERRGYSLLCLVLLLYLSEPTVDSFNGCGYCKVYINRPARASLISLSGPAQVRRQRPQDIITPAGQAAVARRPQVNTASYSLRTGDQSV
jgi:hypothetical protein